MKSYFLSIFGFISLATISLLAYEKWIAAAWLDPDAPKGTPMYTVREWVYGLIYQLAAPIGLLLGFPVVHYTLRQALKTDERLHYTITLALLSLSCISLYQSLAPLDALWQCGFVLCYDVENIEGHMNSHWSVRGLGYRHLKGFQWAIISLMMICALSWSLVTRLLHVYRARNEPCEEKLQPLLDSPQSEVQTSQNPEQLDPATPLTQGQYVTSTNADILLYHGDYSPPTANCVLATEPALDSHEPQEK